MADEEAGKTGKQALAEQYFKLGFELQFDEDKMKKNLDPVMAALNKKLEGLTKASKLEQGIFGKDFFTEKIKGLTGFDNRLVVGIQNIIKFGAASKAGVADNGEFYKSLNFMGKALVDLSSGFRKKKQAEKEAAEQSKETKNDIVSLDDAVGKMEGFQKANESGDLLAANLDHLGPATQDVASGLTKVTAGTEEATTAMEIFESVASLGLAAVVFALIKVGELLYQMVMQAVAARDEFKKFDRMMGGIGSAGVADGIKTLGNLNVQLWGLGQGLGKVNAIVHNFMEAGLSFKQSADANLIGPVIELAGAAGVSEGEVAKLYGTLLKTTNLSMDSMKEIGNNWVAFNRSVSAGSAIGNISFAQLNASITSSANALGIAANKGREFTDKMTKDLTTLAGLANKLGEEVGGINAKFEAAGSMLTDQEDKFRNILVLSGGANFGQMISNQFDKTDAMIKGIKYLQDFNKSFGGNIQLTAQVAAQQFGISKEMAIKMINMRKEAIDDLKKAQEDIAGIQTDATRDAFEKVNSDLGSMWNRIKTMFTTFFQNAFGSSGGMQTLVSKLEAFLGRLRIMMNEGNREGGWLSKLRGVIDKIADWIGNKLGSLIDWISEKLDEFSNPGGSNPIETLWNTLINALKMQMEMMGFLLGKGVVKGLFAMTPLGWLIDKLGRDSSSTGGGSNPITDQMNNPLNDQLSRSRARSSEISRQQSSLEKYQPDAITYGVNANGETGFMTIAQKQFALQQEEKDLAEERELTQKQIAENTRIAAQALTQRKSGAVGSAGLPISDSPFDEQVAAGYVEGA